MEFFSEIFEQHHVPRDLIASAILVVVVLLVRSMALRAVRLARWSSEEIMLRWAVQVRWASLLIVLLGLTVIWFAELRTMALSVVAIAAAIAIATKEIITCIGGTVLRATSRAYEVGDRVEIAGVRGDVIDLGALTTTILEIGPSHRRTGRAVVVPNALLLTEPIINETVSDDFVLHSITVSVARGEIADAERRLLAAGIEVCRPVVDDARIYLDRQARRHNLPVWSVEPRVSIQLSDSERVHLVLRVPAKAREKGLTEQAILRKFLDLEEEPMPAHL